MMIMKEICVYFITITRTLQHYFMFGIKCIAVRVFKASLNHFFNAENKEKITQTYKNDTHQIESKHIYVK